MNFKYKSILIIVTSLLIMGCNSNITKPKEKIQEKDAKVGIMSNIPLNECINSEWFDYEINIKNNSEKIIFAGQPDNGIYKTKASYHWFSDDSILVWDGERTELPKDIRPNEVVKLKLKVQCIPYIGRANLVIDLVQEGEFWFGGKGSQVAKIEFLIK